MYMTSDNKIMGDKLMAEFLSKSCSYPCTIINSIQNVIGIFRAQILPTDAVLA